MLRKSLSVSFCRLVRSGKSFDKRQLNNVFEVRIVVHSMIFILQKYVIHDYYGNSLSLDTVNR